MEARIAAEFEAMEKEKADRRDKERARKEKIARLQGYLLSNAAFLPQIPRSQRRSSATRRSAARRSAARSARHLRH
jgi:predicted phage gp36 major capsid-like protein